MSILKNIWGDPVDAEMEKFKVEIQKQTLMAAQANMQNNAYQNNAYNKQPSGLGQGLVGQGLVGKSATTVYPQGESPESYVMRQVANTNEAMSRVHDQMQRLQAKVETLTGFYTWMTQMYPDLIAQHKAMCDLYAAANPGEDAGTLTGGMK